MKINIVIENVIVIHDDKVPSLLVDFINSIVPTGDIMDADRRRHAIRTIVRRHLMMTDFARFFSVKLGKYNLVVRQRIPGNPHKPYGPTVIMVEY